MANGHLIVLFLNFRISNILILWDFIYWIWTKKNKNREKQSSCTLRHIFNELAVLWSESMTLTSKPTRIFVMSNLIRKRYICYSSSNSFKIWCKRQIPSVWSDSFTLACEIFKISLSSSHISPNLQGFKFQPKLSGFSTIPLRPQQLGPDLYFSTLASIGWDLKCLGQDLYFSTLSIITNMVCKSSF